MASASLLLPLGLASALLLARLQLDVVPDTSHVPAAEDNLPTFHIQIGNSSTTPVMNFEEQIDDANGRHRLSLDIDCRLNTNLRLLMRSAAVANGELCHTLLQNKQQTNDAFLLITVPDHFFGCLGNVKLNGRLLLLHSWCRPRPPPIRHVRTVRLLDTSTASQQEGRRMLIESERLRVPSTPLELFHLRLADGNRLKLKAADLRRVARKASRRRLADWKLASSSDSRALEADVRRPSSNAAPQLMAGPKGPTIHMKPGSRLQLGPDMLRVFDPDTAADRLWLHLEEMSEDSLDLVDRAGMRLRRFSLAEFLAGQVQLLAADEAGTGAADGHATFMARDDAGGQSLPFTLRVTFWPLKVVLDRNTGIRRLAHHSSQLIEPSKLHSHCASQRTDSSQVPAALSARYSIVDQPEFGVIECREKNGGAAAIGNSSPQQLQQQQRSAGSISSHRWSLCSEFLQSDLDSLAVRYRHRNAANRSRADDFGFQVHCADSSSPVQLFQIDFITLSIRVFVQEALALNQTDQAVLTRRNMLATVFPQNFRPDQLIYHLVEAPKLGMLLRQVPETGRPRRVGISSNFSQEQIEQGLLSYKLHFAPFSVLNDFFTFRLLTPAGSSDEVFRFDIVYLPGGGFGEIRLLNRTLVVTEGGIQQISNATLWLEAADGSRQFTFRLWLPPLNGRLLLLDQRDGGRRRVLDFDDSFRTDDILAHRLFYEHSGEAAARWDRAFLVAESELRDPGGGKGHTPVPFFLSVTIVDANNHPPQLRQSLFGQAAAEHHIHISLLENGERTLWPWLLPLVDLDSWEWSAPLEQSPFFPVARTPSPLFLHLLPEPANARDFVICTRAAPEMPLRDFGEDQLRRGQLILRHLGGARNATQLKLTVNDGRHTTPVPVWMSAAPKPLLRLTTPNRLKLPLASVSVAEGQRAYFLLTIAHLWAETNVDVPDSAIVFQHISLVPTSPFQLLLPNGTFQETREFSQKDIWENRLFYAVEATSGSRDQQQGRNETAFLKLMIRVADMQMPAELPEVQELILNFDFTNQQKSTGGPQIKNVPIFISGQGLTVQRGGSSPVDGTLLGIAAAEDDDLVAKFHVIKGPAHGGIIFQRQQQTGTETAPSANYNIPLLSFDSAILQSGSLQYLASPTNMAEVIEGDDDDLEDGFVLKMMVKSQKDKNLLIQIDAIHIPVHISGRNELQLLATQLSVQSGTKVPLNEHHLRLLRHSEFTALPLPQMHFKIVESPASLVLLSRSTGQRLNSFSQSHLTAGDVQLLASDSGDQRCAIVLRACEERHHLRHSMRCSQPTKLWVQVRGSREKALNLKHNNPLQLRGNKETFVISADQLFVQSLHVPSKQIHFLPWQQKGGFLFLKNSDPTSKLDNFTQEDLEQSRVHFKISDPSQEKIGFNFIYSDGFSQYGPEWFGIEADNNTSSMPSATNHKAIAAADGDSRLLLEVNEKLLAAPGTQIPITSRVLRAVGGKVNGDKIVYRLTKPPMHGRLQLSGSTSKVEQFTQWDIDTSRLSYKTQANLGAWLQPDTFQFKLAAVSADSAKISKRGEELFTFHIETSYSHIDASGLGQFVPRTPIAVSSGGSVALNISHLNLTKLADFADDNIFLMLHQGPAQGWLERMDELPGFDGTSEAAAAATFGFAGKRKAKGGQWKKNSEEEDEKETTNFNKWNTPLTAEHLHSGAHLVYRNVRNLSSSSSNSEEVDSSREEDEFTLIAFGNREPGKGLKLQMKIRIVEGPKLLKINRFPKELSIVSGGIVRLNPKLLSASHPALPASNIFYQIVQHPRSGIRLAFSPSNASSSAQANLTTKFSQQQINEETVVIEHVPIDESRKWDLIGLRLMEEGNAQIGHSLVLVVRIEPLALQLRNFTEIQLVQGKTYVLLDRRHLGAESNGDRSLIAYNITRRPENGTFYWVDGEKEASTFTQVDIDNGEVLYAQMNMNAYQDSFEFVLSNDEIELLPKKAMIRVQPLFQPQLLFTNSRTITQLGLAYLNATALEGSSPSYAVVEGPKHGRLFLHHPQSNNESASATFFTHDDVATGRLFFHAFDVTRRITDHILLELRSDSVQPARMVWPIDIRPVDGMMSSLSEEEAEIRRAGFGGAESEKNVDGTNSPTDQQQNDKDVIIPPPPPDMNYHFPIAILIAVVCLVIGILLCRRGASEGSVDSDDEDRGGHKKSSSSENGRGGGASSSLKSSLKRKSGDGTGAKNRFPGTSSSTMQFADRGAGAMDVKNLLDATVYATINYRQQSKEHNNGSNNIFSQNEEEDLEEAEANNEATTNYNYNDAIQHISPAFPARLSLNNPSAIAGLATIPSLLVDDTFGTLSKRRRDSSSSRPPTMTTLSRSNSKEQQQLLASAVSAALALKNPAAAAAAGKNDSDSQHMDERKSTGKNEFWV